MSNNSSSIIWVEALSLREIAAFQRNPGAITISFEYLTQQTNLSLWEIGQGEGSCNHYVLIESSAGMDAFWVLLDINSKPIIEYGILGDNIQEEDDHFLSLDTIHKVQYLYLKASS